MEVYFYVFTICQIFSVESEKNRILELQLGYILIFTSLGVLLVTNMMHTLRQGMQ